MRTCINEKRHLNHHQSIQRAVKFDHSESVRLELKAETLFRLLKNQQLCAEDFDCLDCESKQCVLRLMLDSILIAQPNF